MNNNKKKLKIDNFGIKCQNSGGDVRSVELKQTLEEIGNPIQNKKKKQGITSIPA